MNKLYFIESSNFQLINLEVSKILQEIKQKEKSLIKYDLSTTNLLNLINEIDTYSFFNEIKVVLGYDATFLTTNKSEVEQNSKILEDYINNPSSENILILAASKLDGKKNICKLIKKTFTFIDLNIDLPKYIQTHLPSNSISKPNIDYLISLVGEDISRLDNEINKLECYVDTAEEITRDIIDLVVVRRVEDDFFALSEKIINRDKSESIRIYEDLINNKTDIFKIIINLSYQFRLIYQIKILSYLQDEEIGDILLNKNIKQIRAIRYKLSKFSEKELLNNLYAIAILDEKIKTGQIMEEIAIPLFIANL